MKKYSAILWLLMMKKEPPKQEIYWHEDDLRSLQLCAIHWACCQTDLLKCRICADADDTCDDTDAVYRSTFPDPILTDPCSGWGKCGEKNVDCSKTDELWNPPTCPFKMTFARGSGTQNFIASADDIMSRQNCVDNPSWIVNGDCYSHLCITWQCRLVPTGGVDHSPCWENYDIRTGMYDVNTDDLYPCLRTGIGTYRYECSCTLSWVDASFTPDDCVTLHITDYCEAPLNTITGLTPSNWSYQQYLVLDQRTEQVPLSSYLTIADTTNCAFTSCKVIKADQVTKDCTTGTVEPYFIGAQNAGDPTKIDLVTDTSLQQPLTWFCLACLTNDLTPWYAYSQAFTHEIIPIDCTPFVSLTNPLATDYKYEVPNTLSIPSRQAIFSNTPFNYATSTDTHACPLDYEIWDFDSNTQLGATDWIQIDPMTGKVSYDEATLEKTGKNLFVRVKSREGFFIDTPPFYINNQCKPYTMSPVTTPNVHYIPVTPNVPVDEIVVDAKTLLTPADYTSPTGAGSDQSVCQLTWTLLQNGAPYVGTQHYLDGTQNLKVNVNTKNLAPITGFSIKVETPDGTFVESNPATTEFDVQVICASSGYVVTQAIPLVEKVTHQVPVPNTEPTYSMTSFEPYQQPLCKAITYEFLDSQLAGAVLPAGMTTKSVPDGLIDAILNPSTAIYPISTAWGLIMLYQFYIKVTLEGGQTFWADNDAATNLFYLDVVCGPFSTSITEDLTYCCGMADVQYKPKNQGNCFTLPSYTNSNPSCPILTRTTSLTSAPPPVVIGSGLQDPSFNVLTGQWEVCPTDDTLDKTYDFYVYMAAKGGHEKVTVKYTYHHGCPAGVPVFTQGPNYYTSIVKYINVDKLDIWKFDGSVWPTPNCEIEKLELFELKYDYFGHQYAANLASSCGGTDPCEYVDIFWNNHVHDVSYKIKVTITNNNIAYADEVIIQVRCNIYSAILGSTLQTAQTVNITQHEDGTFSYDPFTCTPPDCCTNNYYTIAQDGVSANANADPRYTTPVLDTDSNSPTFGKYTFKLFSGDLGPHTIHIQYKNAFGTNVYSAPITVNVLYNCTYAWIDFSPNRINYGEERAPLEETLLLDNVPRDSENLEMIIPSRKYTNLEFEVRKRFVSNASQWCPINYFEIYKFVDVASGLIILPKDWDDRIKMYSDGRLWMERMNNPYAVRVYANVSNGKVWLQDTDPFMYIEIKVPWLKPFNFPPYFDGGLEDLYLNATVDENFENIYQIQLPLVKDSIWNDTYQIIIENMPPWMTLDNEKRQIRIYYEKISDYQMDTRNWNIILTDQLGAYREYNFNLGFFRDPWIHVPRIEAKPFDWDPTQNATAYIHSIDYWGLMEIRFNSSMFTYFNISYLNTSLLDIYLDPSYKLEEGFNMSSINFTWNATYYNNTEAGYAVMKIQLNWNDPLAISPEVIQDNVVWHIKKEFMGFYSPQVGKMLDKGSWTLRYRARKQLGHEWRPWMDMVTIKRNIMMFMLIFTFLMSQLPGGANFRYFMWYMRTMQYIVHLPMIHVVIPANAMAYFEMIFPVVTFNFIPRDYLAYTFFTFDLESQRKFAVESMHDQSEDLAYDTFNAVLILGTIWLFSMIYVARVFLYYLVRLYKHKYPQWFTDIDINKYEGGNETAVTVEELKEKNPRYIMKPVYIKQNGKIIKYFIKEEVTGSYGKGSTKQKGAVVDSMTCKECMAQLWLRIRYYSWKFTRWLFRTIFIWERFLFWTVILGLFLEPYMEWCAAGIYNLRHTTDLNTGDRYGNYTGIICVWVAFALVPGVLIFLFQHPARYLYNRQFMRKFGYVFHELKKRDEIHKCYFGFYVARRLQFFWIAFDISPWPCLQLILMLVQSLFFHWYVGTKPWQSKSLRFLFMFEEVIILAAILHLCVFSGWGYPTETARIGWGWSLIIVISLHFLIVVIWILWQFIDYLKLLWLYYQAVWRVWCVRAFGFRIGTSYKDKFDVKTNDRKVPQMMKLEENINKDHIGMHLEQTMKSMNVKDKKSLQFINHLPHMIEKFDGQYRENPALAKQQMKILDSDEIPETNPALINNEMVILDSQEPVKVNKVKGQRFNNETPQFVDHSMNMQSPRFGTTHSRHDDSPFIESRSSEQDMSVISSQQQSSLLPTGSQLTSKPPFEGENSQLAIKQYENEILADQREKVKKEKDLTNQQQDYEEFLAGAFKNLTLPESGVSMSFGGNRYPEPPKEPLKKKIKNNISKYF